MSKITIIEPNASDKDQVKAYMVKGEKGDGATIDVSKTDGVATITINDNTGTKTVQISDGEITKAMIVDNLTSTDTQAPLSARQGKILKELIDTAGDMQKSIYDTDNDGVVDNADKVNNHTVESDVPSNAVFTDTVYDDTALQTQITGIQSSLENYQPKVLSGTSAPSSSTGNDGDLYLQYE